MAENGTCRNCYYFKKAGWDGAGFLGSKDGWCYVLKNGFGNQKAVNGGDSCQYYTPGTAEVSGFKKGGGDGCFLTSACVKYLGRSDDCEELTLLRKYRDEYLKATSEGRIIVEEYYKIAPAIVEKIEQKENKEEYYQYIYSYVEKCVEFIKAQKYEETLHTYKRMVVELQKQFI